MKPDEEYQLLQNLASPVVAITSRWNDNVNGMIANSAVRASLVPEISRISFYCFKQHYSHKMISRSGQFCMHFLHREQFSLVRQLGFESGRDQDKLENISWQFSDSGLPVLDDVFAWFECSVLNAMDAGPSTFFLGEVNTSGKHPDINQKKLMNSPYFRQNMPEQWKPLYRENKQAVQAWAMNHAEVDPEWSWNPTE